MKITPKLQQKLAQAVQTSMRIEGYRAQATPKTRSAAKSLMEQQRVQVSVPAK